MEIKNFQNVIFTICINFMCRFMGVRGGGGGWWEGVGVVGGGRGGVRVETTCHIAFVVLGKIRLQCSLCS